jgi:hypothetical protein
MFLQSLLLFAKLKGLVMSTKDNSKYGGNDLTALIDTFRERVNDIEERMKEINQILLPTNIVCEKCSHVISEVKDTSIPFIHDIPSELNCPQCGFPNIIKKL